MSSVSKNQYTLQVVLIARNATTVHPISKCSNKLLELENFQLFTLPEHTYSSMLWIVLLKQNSCLTSSILIYYLQSPFSVSSVTEVT